MLASNNCCARKGMRLKPIIQHCVVAGLLVLSVPSWAVGLGRLTLQSGLGQALSAEIELTSVQSGEIDTLTARLADQATYRNNKIDYGNALARVRVVLEQRGGRPVLKVSSTQPINEPFLDLLIEINWATGRLLREYTFLLDPPGFAATTAVEPATAIPAQTLAPPSPTAAPSASAASASASSAAPQAGGNSYGPVKRGETLGRIAAQVKADGVTLEQMLTALYRANIRAFDSKNMNRLRVGQILNVPKSDEAAAVTNSDAKKEIRVQAADWRAYRDRLAGAVSGGEAQSAGQIVGGRITTAVEDKVATASGGDKLRLSKGETVPGTGSAAGRAENALASQKAVAEANSRVVDLEKQVKSLQRLLELKNPSLQPQQAAVEQVKTEAKSPPASPASTTPATTAAPEAPTPTQTISPAPAPPAAAPQMTTAAMTAGELAKAEATKSSTLAAGEPSKAAPQKSETKAADADAAAAKADPSKPKPPLRPPQPQQEQSLLDDLLGNPLVLVGGVAAIGLAFVYWLLARRRRRATTKFEDSIGAGTDIRTSTVFGNTGGGVVNTGDNSLVSDFSREGLGNIDTGEVDPIAEAEVYLAYGRDNQAEEILRDALGKTPDRQEIRLKLLEIYAQQNKPAVFETIASEVHAATNGSGDIWAKAAQLGRGIDPANPLYAENAEQGGAADASAPAPERGDDRLPDSKTRITEAVEKSEFETSFDLPEAPKREVFVMPPALTPAEPAHGVAASGPSSLSAPLAAAAAASVAAAAASRASAVHERAPLDFKLDSVPDLPPQAASPTMDFVTLDGPITLTGATTLSGPSTLSGVTLASASADIWGEKPLFPLQEKLNAGPLSESDELPALKPDDVTVPAVAAAVAAGTVSMASFSPMTTSTMTRAPQPSGKLDLDKLDLSFDPTRKTFDDPTPSVLDGQWHDAATKLDLAKAYQEMGDVEGAREILQEVMQEGDEQQKKEAQTFLAKLRS
jgi:pilus assembly protein FimV